MRHSNAEVFSRNIGLITESDQEKVSNATIGMAGTGADGGLPAERIVRLGIKGIKLADPDSFDASNINRQFGATEGNIGRNKCEVVAEELLRIRPDLEVEIYNKGVDSVSVNEFVSGCDIIIDEIEYTKPSVSVLLHRAARKKGVQVLVGLTLGYGVNIYRFVPDGITFEQAIDYKDGQKDSDFDMSKMVPNIPKYVDKEVLRKVLNRETYIPAVSPAVGLLSGLMSFAVLGALLGKNSVPPVPNFLHLDMLEQTFQIM